MDFLDVIKLRIFRWEDGSVFPGRPDTITRVLVRERGKQKSQRRGFDNDENTGQRHVTMSQEGSWPQKPEKSRNGVSYRAPRRHTALRPP